MNKYIFLFLLSFVPFVYSCSQNETEEKEQILKHFNLLLDESDLAKIYSDPNKDIYIPVKIIYKNDTVKAKMRLRGDTSRGYDKKSMKIVFDKKHTLNGEKRKINLNSEWTDKSYIRQYLSSYLMNKAGINSFKSNFVELRINNKFFGLFLQVENVDDKFLTDRGLDKNANLYKATRDGACLSIHDKIEKYWEKKSNKNTDWQDLNELIQTLDTIKNENFYSYLKENFEYDKIITISVMNMLIQNGSTYYHNYYMYHDIYGTGKWQMFPWDMDKSMSYYNWEPYAYYESTNKWLSDNVLIEKMFINEQVKSDLLKKLDELEKNVFNNKNIDPLIDTLSVVLENAVKRDTLDQIDNVEKWKHYLKGEKDFVYKQVKYIRNQLTSFPTGFEVKRIDNVQIEPPVLEWSASKSLIDNKIIYTVYYGTDYLFEDKKKTKIIKNIKDTSYKLPKNIKLGKYYWKVVASDGENKVDGYNRFNFFEYKAPTEIKSDISTNTTWTKEKSPYFITKNINIPKNITLTIEAGTDIILKKGVGLYFNGNIIIKGTKKDNVIFRPFNDEWGEVYLTNGKADINYTVFNEGVFRAKRSDVEIKNTEFIINKKNLLYDNNRQAVIWIKGGSFTFSHSKIFGNGIGEGMNINKAKTIVTYSYFNNTPDAIEVMTVDSAYIYKNYVENSPDDAIDMNGCKNVIVEANYLINNKDKAVSVGTEEYGPTIHTVIYNNLIIGNGTAFSAKDSSDLFASNNTLIDNNIGIKSYLKNNIKHYNVGGKIDAKNIVFYNSKIKDIELGKKSEINIKNSISNKTELKGKKNTKKDIKFINPDRGNYFLSENKKYSKIGYYGDSGFFIEVKRNTDYLSLKNPNLYPIDISDYKIILDGKAYILPKYKMYALEEILIAKSTKKLLKNTDKRLVEYKTINISAKSVKVSDNLNNIIFEMNE